MFDEKIRKITSNYMQYSFPGGEIIDDILMNTDFLFQWPCQKR